MKSRFVKNSLYFMLLLFIFSFVSISIVWIYNYNEIDNYIESEEYKFSDNISRMNKHLQEVSDILYDTTINTKEVVDIFKDVHTADETQKKILRLKLYNMLKEKYTILQKYNVQLLHFHLPDQESFLRFHQPDIYGDNLKDTRKTVVYVATHKTSTYSFEEGKIYNGFRYVYPLFYKKQYIGSVEISYSSKSFQQIFEDIFENHMDFVIRKDVVKEKLFKNQLKNFYEYPLNKNFLFQRDMKISNNNRQLWKSLAGETEIKMKMDRMEQFATYTYNKAKHQYYVISFIPIKNLHTNKKVAYSIISEPSKFLDTIIFNFQMQVLFSIFVSLLLAYISYKEIKSKVKMKDLFRKLSEYARKNRVILDLSNDMIITIKNNLINDANKKFLTFYQKKDVDDLGYIKEDIEYIFLHEEGCFSINSIKKQHYWIDEILQLNDEERVVCILDKDVNKSYFHLYISALDIQNNEYLIYFKEITKTRREYQILEKQAYYDNLTQIYNRHFFMNKFSKFYDDMDSTAQEYSLIMFDVDHFKEINDKYGHDVGDKALFFLAKIVKKNIRENDIFARWGGEEFMLLVNSNIHSAAKISENLRINIKKSTQENDEVPMFTCSFGIVCLKDHSNIDTILKAVDKKLYEAKSTGRDKVVY